jgi:hypothetical protein
MDGRNNKNTFDLKCFGNESTDFHKVVQCINNETFKHNDIIEEYRRVKTKNETDITKDTIYAEDISFFFVGKAHSFNISFAEEDDLGFSIYFKPGYNYSIFIHDPHFYMFTTNPGTIPYILLHVDDMKSQDVFFTTTYHNMMNKPEKRCESSETYRFTACVKNSISRRVGCRMEWDVWSSRDIPVCTRVEQLERFDKEYFGLWGLPQPYVVKNTGCLKPCSYTEYKLGAESTNYHWKTHRLNVRLSSPEVLKRTEQLLYPMESFISEFGGALGLFLGFSCMMIWDALECFFHYCLKAATSVKT